METTHQSKRHFVRAIQMPCDGTVEIDGQYVGIKTGDWIVTQENKGTWVMTADEFKRQYEAVTNSPPWFDKPMTRDAGIKPNPNPWMQPLGGYTAGGNVS